jgi:hypothetical protein
MLVLVLAALFAWRTQLVSQVVVQRARPLHLYQPSTRHYHVLAAPAGMPYPDPLGPSYTTINAVGQVLVYDTLWTPPGIAGTEAQVVDFFNVLHASPDTSRLEATALNDYGQVAGFVHAATNTEYLNALFLWTPLRAHGSVGSVTYLTDPSVQNDHNRVRGLNDYG